MSQFCLHTVCTQAQKEINNNVFPCSLLGWKLNLEILVGWKPAESFLSVQLTSKSSRLSSMVGSGALQKWKLLNSSLSDVVDVSV